MGSDGDGGGSEGDGGGGLSYDIRESQYWGIRGRVGGGGNKKKIEKGEDEKKKKKEEVSDCHRWEYRAWQGG